MCRLTLTLTLLVTALLLFAVGCSVDRRTPAATTLVPVVLDAELRQTDPFSLDSVAVEDDVLTAVVSYSGGCRNHEFTLMAPLPFQVSAGSVQLAITLIHDAKGDPCEAYPSEQLRFDLRPINRRYQETFGKDSGTVYLRLAGHSGPLVYRF